jgi:phage tail protein X
MATNFYKYTTKEGDMFDMIALNFYNEEKMATTIIEANPDYADVVVFDADIELIIPIVQDTEGIETKPPWRR